MPLTIKQIMDEADVRVQNSLNTADKVSFLNQVNLEFFDVVKMPQAVVIPIATGVSQISTNGILGKNIDRVLVGKAIYDSMQYTLVQPGRNFWTFDDFTGRISLNPAPASAVDMVIRYYRKPITTFLSTGLTVVPDAPEEYHWIYILGLCERIAKAMDDVGKGNNYASDYKSALMVAQQNFQRGA